MVIKLDAFFDNSDIAELEEGEAYLRFICGGFSKFTLTWDSGNKKLEGWQHEANYTQRGKEWERPVYCEYLSADGSVLFGQDMGIRIMGAASRNESQKSLRLTAREDLADVGHFQYVFGHEGMPPLSLICSVPFAPGLRGGRERKTPKCSEKVGEPKRLTHPLFSGNTVCL